MDVIKQKKIVEGIERSARSKDWSSVHSAATLWLMDPQSPPQLCHVLLTLRSRAFEETGKIVAAIKDLQNALTLDPKSARLWNDLGTLWITQRESGHARKSFLSALAVDKKCASAWANWVRVEYGEGQYAEAERVAKQALAFNPEMEQVWLLLAEMYQQTQRFSDAVGCLHSALARHPQSDRLYALLGDVAADIDDVKTAKLAYRKAFQLNPALFRAWIREQLVLPHVYESIESLNQARADFIQGLSVLKEERGKKEKLKGVSLFSNLRNSNFLLAYQGEDDLSLQKDYAQFIAKVIEETSPQQRAPLPWRFDESKKIRIGFISSFLRDSTIGRYFESWLTDLDARFEVFFYQLWRTDDALVDRLKMRADHTRYFVNLPISVIVQQIRKDDLAVLVYPELGLGDVCFMLAALRLAPLQCAAWGHPVTTGHDTIDVFFSSAEMEPPNGEEHYSEKLILLPGLGTRYIDPSEGMARVDRKTLRLPERGTLLLCPQSLFKIHPDNDRLFAKILQATSDAHLLFFKGSSPAWEEKFLARFGKNLDSLGVDRGRIHFLPYAEHEQYLAINKACDLMLDTLYWSGGNTSIDALSVGLPIVTLPGRFMRGRQSMAMLKTIGAQELIVKNEGDYVKLAVDLVERPGLRREISEKILRNKHKLFNQTEGVNAFQEFLVSARQKGRGFARQEQTR